MRHLPTTKNGHLTKKQHAFFGGAYGVKEKLLLNGIGASKLIYQGGIEIFDSVIRDSQWELAFVNFELLKNGLILRLNINQRKVCAGVRLNEIRSIKIQILNQSTPSMMESDVKLSRLMILLKDGSFSEFTIPYRFEKNIISFFKKSIFMELDLVNFSSPV